MFIIVFKRSPDTIPQVQSDSTGHQPGRPVYSLGNISHKTLFNNLIELITYIVFQHFIPESFDLHRNLTPEIPSIAFHTDNRKVDQVDRRPRRSVRKISSHQHLRAADSGGGGDFRQPIGSGISNVGIKRS